MDKLGKMGFRFCIVLTGFFMASPAFSDSKDTPDKIDITKHNTKIHVQHTQDNNSQKNIQPVTTNACSNNSNSDPSIQKVINLNKSDASTTVDAHPTQIKLSTGTVSGLDVHGDQLIHLAQELDNKDVSSKTTTTATTPATTTTEISDHPHVAVTSQVIHEVLDNMVSMVGAVQAETAAINQGGQIVLGAVKAAITTPSNPVNPPISTPSETINQAVKTVITVNPINPVNSVNPVNPENNNKSVVNNRVVNSPNIPTTVPDTGGVVLENKGLEKIGESSVVVGQIVQSSGSVAEVDTSGISHELSVGDNVHLGGKFVFTGGTGNLMIKSFSGELTHVVA